MATETRYVVRSNDNKRGKTCHSIETAKWLADEWRNLDGKRGVYIEQQTITTRRIYSV